MPIREAPRFQKRLSCTARSIARREDSSCGVTGVRGIGSDAA